MRKFGLFLMLLIFTSLIPREALSNAAFISTISLKILHAGKDTSDLYRHIKHALSFSSKYEKIQNMKAAIDSAEAICADEHIEFPSLLHLARAEYFFLASDYRNASQEANIAMNRAKSTGEPDVMAKIMNFFGRYNFRTGFFKESVDYFNNAMIQARKNNMKGFIPKNYYDLAILYNTMGKLDEFRNTLKLLINSAVAEKDTFYIETGYFRLGTSYTDLARDFRRADSLLKKSLDLALKKKDTVFTSLSLSNLGWNYYNEKRYGEAIKYYNRSLEYSIPAKIFFNSTNSYGNLGTIYRDMGDMKRSRENYIEALAQGKAGKDVYNLSWIYKDMSDMYLMNSDTSNAYKSFVMFKVYSDSLMKSQKTEGLAEARIRYEAETRNRELELLSLRIKNQKLLIYGYTGLFVLSLAILLLLLSRAKINNKRRISEMNRKISEITQANLRQQMNPHFIFNTLNSIQYYMYQHDKLATNNYLTKFSSLMRRVLENSRHTSVPLQDELDALKLYLDLEMIRFKDRFDYIINVDEEIDPILYKVPTMLIQPYVENSICHGLMPAEGKGTVKIDIKLKNEHISCIIEDNGIGREAALQRRRSSENNHNPLGTQIVSSRLDLVNALYGTSLKTIYTDLRNEAGEPSGTKVEIQIPILT
jgi:two-component system, LytTR family, sensor kinase